MNKFYIIGNLTKDPELFETSAEVKYCKFTVAVDRPYAGSNGLKKVDFFNCLAWRGLAETIVKYLKKGNKVAVNGRVELNGFEDGQGIKRTGVDVVVNDIEFLSARSSNEDDVASKKLQPPIIIDDSNIPF